MTDVRFIALGAVLAGLVVALAARPVLSALPEPADPGVKVAYADLPTPGFVLGCGLLAMAAEATALVTLPIRVQPLWVVLGTCGALLATIDARTTWLPRRLTYAGWALMGLAAALTVALGATWGDLSRTLAGAGVAGVLYLLIWVATRGGFGFGDVRFAPLLGAATAGQSWTLLLWGLTLGTAAGALHGSARLLARKPGGFPYAPSMLSGSYLAAAAMYLLTR